MELQKRVRHISVVGRVDAHNAVLLGRCPVLFGELIFEQPGKF
jgi:hypothetical protein